MALRVYNTLTKKKEDFIPIDPPKVGMYVCGVTVYDLSHIGHARSTIAFDVIQRYLRYREFDVTYVRNFTDIDDKIIRRANELGCAIDVLTGDNIRAFTHDMQALGLQTPDLEPRCTDYIEGMIAFIGKLVEDGYAYPTPSGDVYYRVHNFKGYGKLSGKNLDDLEAGARVEVSEEKESPGDFALWKASKPGEPEWPSPWGAGRPGWHIECSVMSTHNLGTMLDIHGGGKDLMFPHHENEIAQSEAHNGQPYAKYWLHNGFVNVPSNDNPDGDKMSKSLGNFYTIRDVLAAYHPQTVKFFMLSTHYRNDVMFTEEGLTKAQGRVSYFYDTIANAQAWLAAHPAESGQLLEAEKTEAVLPSFEAAMDDDFNTQRVFGQLSGVFKIMNDLMAGGGQTEADTAATLERLLNDLKVIAGVLGVFDLDPMIFASELRALRLAQIGMAEADVEALIAARQAAREAKDWARADEVRDELMAKGILVKDAKGVTTWTVKN